jgi:glycosyltransferase involved in cell wall biosynthesis
MEKILFIAYQFPPRGGPGVHRSLNLVKHLREFGYDPIVLTIDDKSIREAGGPYDETLLAGIPAGIEIVRTPSHEPRKFTRLMMKLRLYRLAWFFFYPLLWETAARWPGKVYPAAEELVKKHGIRLVYTSSGPFSSLFIGRKLKRRLGIKWVADLRDPFTDAYAWLFPGKLHWYFARRMEKKILREADKLVVNTNATRKLFLRREITAAEKITVITNGF